MKNILFYTLLISSAIGFAQNSEVKDIKVQMSKGVQPGVEVFIQGANEDQVREAIKDNTRKFRGDDERIRRSEERYIDDARIEQISDNDIDIHYLIKEENKGSSLQLFFNLGAIFLSPELDIAKYNFMKNLAGKIAIDATQLNYDELIKVQENVLSDIVRDQDRAKDDIKRAQRDIEKAKNEIEKKEKEIKELESKINKRSSIISKENEKLKDLKSEKSKAK
jgi:hypothetical protein